MKKKLVAMIGVVCLGMSLAHAEKSLIDFDGREVKSMGGIDTVWLTAARTIQAEQVSQPAPVVSVDMGPGNQQAEGIEEKEAFKIPDSCNDSVKKDFFQNLFFIDAQPMFSYEYLPKLQKCSSEEQVSHLLEYLGGKAPQSKINSGTAQKYPASRECTTSNGCRYCKECGYVCLKMKDGVCVKWSDEEVCWWELQYCTAK